MAQTRADGVDDDCVPSLEEEEESGVSDEEVEGHGETWGYHDDVHDEEVEGQAETWGYDDNAHGEERRRRRQQQGWQRGHRPLSAYDLDDKEASGEDEDDGVAPECFRPLTTKTTAARLTTMADDEEGNGEDEDDGAPF